MPDLTEEMLATWPNCSVPDCGWKACLRLDSDKCHAHALGLIPDEPGSKGPVSTDVVDVDTAEILRTLLEEQ